MRRIVSVLYLHLLFSFSLGAQQGSDITAKPRNLEAASDPHEQETQLDALRKNIQNTEVQRDNANLQLTKMIEDLQLEATL